MMTDIAAIPHALKNRRFMPLAPGTKVPLKGVEHATWDEAAPWDPGVDEYLGRGGMRVGVFMGDDYLVLDADIKMGWEDDGSGVQKTVIIKNGNDIVYWLMSLAKIDALPPTTKIKTQGGGTHWWFRQNSECRISQKKIESLDVKAHRNAYCAIGEGYELLEDADIPVIPLELARVLVAAKITATKEISVDDSGKSMSQYGDIEHGFNNLLTEFKGLMVKRGFTDETANQAVWELNMGVPSPVSREKFDETVGRHKGWVQGELMTDDVYEWARRQLGLAADDPDNQYRDDATVRRLWTTERWKQQRRVSEAMEQLSRLEIMSGADAADETPVPWQLHGILPRTGTGAIIGGRGSYKTTLTLLMGAAITRGTMCLDRIPAQGKVVFAAGEAWEYTSRMIPKIPGATDMVFTKGRFGLSVETAPQFCDRLMSFMNESPSMIVIDTLSRFHNGDENKPSEMLQVWDGADYIARELDTFVFLIAHTGHNGEHVRGASSWGQALNTEIYTDGNILRFNKQRGVAEPADINLMYTFSDTLIKVEEGVDLARRARSINDKHDQICRALEREPACSSEKAYEVIMSIMKCNRTDASSTLKTLVEEGRIEHVQGRGRIPAQISVILDN